MDQDLITRLLKNLWEFRRTVQTPFDRGFIGELLVLRQLLRTYKTGSIKYFGSANRGRDFELTLKGRTIQIEVKSTSEWDKNKNPKWVRQHARNFCDIKIDKRSAKQYVSPRKDHGSNLFWVFVDVKTWFEKKQTSFFVLLDKKVKARFGEKYQKLYHKKIRKSQSDDCWIEYADVKNFKDNRLTKLLK